MEKKAQGVQGILSRVSDWFQGIPREYQNAIITGLMGGAGTGIASALTGGRVPEDVLLGVLLGGVAGYGGTRAGQYFGLPSVRDRLKKWFQAPAAEGQESGLSGLADKSWEALPPEFRDAYQRSLSSGGAGERWKERGLAAGAGGVGGYAAGSRWDRLSRTLGGFGEQDPEALRSAVQKAEAAYYKQLALSKTDPGRASQALLRNRASELSKAIARESGHRLVGESAKVPFVSKLRAGRRLKGLEAQINERMRRVFANEAGLTGGRGLLGVQEVMLQRGPGEYSRNALRSARGTKLPGRFRRVAGRGGGLGLGAVGAAALIETLRGRSGEQQP
jgi:hypothetical protein